MTHFWVRTALFFRREFGRWKVNNLAVERRNFLGSPLPLAPEFFRNIRLLGRRPTLQQITENLIKKYGTHFLLSATLGGRVNSRECWGWAWCEQTKSAGRNFSYSEPLGRATLSVSGFCLRVLWPLLVGALCGILCTKREGIPLVRLSVVKHHNKLLKVSEKALRIYVEMFLWRVVSSPPQRCESKRHLVSALERVEGIRVVFSVLYLSSWCPYSFGGHSLHWGH